MTHYEIQQAVISQSRDKCGLHKASFAVQNQQHFGLYSSSHVSHKSESLMLQAQDRSILKQNHSSRLLMTWAIGKVTCALQAAHSTDCINQVVLQHVL